MTAQEPTQRILLVDDEQAVLDGMCRQYRKMYSLVPACGALAGIQAIVKDGPFAVVVTDFKMPVMNGTQFLAKARRHDPDMIPVMLTGQADLATAIDAVNRGHIFRFLSKPCDPEVLQTCLDAALEQYQLRSTERLLLEETVRGSVEVLTEVLALSNPAAFGKATRIRDVVRDIVEHLKLPDGWRFETAALLSQIGFVAIPDDLLDRVVAGQEVPADQLAMMNRHPAVARHLLSKIPRLQTVAEIVYHQIKPPCPSDDPIVVIGGAMLAAALQLEDQLALGVSYQKALIALSDPELQHDKRVLTALAAMDAKEPTEATVAAGVRQFRVGFTLQEEVRNSDGRLIVNQGHEVTAGSLERLRNYAEIGELEKTEYRVTLPKKQKVGRGKEPA